MKNREIKFRAWNKETEQWLENFDLVNLDNGVVAVWTDFQGNKQDEYKNVVLVQYTGLKDKNGKEIYEGDIVIEPHSEFEPRSKYQVIWNEGDYRYSLLLKHELYGSHERHFRDAFQMKIIGNIYENPELLK